MNPHMSKTWTLATNPSWKVLPELCRPATGSVFHISYDNTATNNRLISWKMDTDGQKHGKVGNRRPVSGTITMYMIDIICIYIYILLYYSKKKYYIVYTYIVYIVYIYTYHYVIYIYILYYVIHIYIYYLLYVIYIIFNIYYMYIYIYHMYIIFLYCTYWFCIYLIWNAIHVNKTHWPTLLDPNPSKPGSQSMFFSQNWAKKKLGGSGSWSMTLIINHCHQSSSIIYIPQQATGCTGWCLKPPTCVWIGTGTA